MVAPRTLRRSGKTLMIAPEVSLIMKAHGAYRQLVSKTSLEPGLDIMLYVTQQYLNRKSVSVTSVLTQEFASEASVKRSLRWLLDKGFLMSETSKQDRRVRILYPSSEFISNWFSALVRVFLGFALGQLTLDVGFPEYCDWFITATQRV